MNKSRIPNFYKLSVAERIVTLERLGLLSAAAARDLQDGQQVLAPTTADKMIENVVGVFGLPFAIAPNFIINGRECLVPLVVEEPSIVAALSNAAATARETGGFSASCEESLLTGQIHLTNVADIDAAITSIQNATELLLEFANDIHPRLKARGGGVRELVVRPLNLPDGRPFLAVHVLVDTCDAMGANLVNTVCEALAPKLAELTDGNIALRILSNLADRSVFTANVRFSVDQLATKVMSGEKVRDGIVLANDIALADPHRAATHNKGIMNGIDAVAIASGNDWRAIEAGAHAFAARGGAYSTLTRWSVDGGGALLGELQIAIKTGIVGGTVESNPAAAMGLAIAGVESAVELAEMMAAVGLAQNFAALRALVTTGIQQGHMRLHARSVAVSAGTPEHRLEEVVARLLVGGEVKQWRAKEILTEMEAADNDFPVTSPSAAGKVILFGEHAAVYGRHAVALPIVDAVRVKVAEATDSTILQVTDWGLNCQVDRNSDSGIDAVINLILNELGVAQKQFTIGVRSVLPRGAGLGSSAAFAAAVTRAVADCIDLPIDNQRLNKIAFECEKIAHGTPSGIDNTIACFAQPMLFRNADDLDIQPLELPEAPPLVIGFSHDVGLTRRMVAGVRSRYELGAANYEAIFDQIDHISVQGASALLSQNYDEVGRLMNVCHGLLNALEVSTPDLERLVTVARQHGAAGAKITGAGGGGAMVALCPESIDSVRTGIQQAGYRTLVLPQYRSRS